MDPHPEIIYAARYPEDRVNNATRTILLDAPMVARASTAAT